MMYKTGNKSNDECNPTFVIKQSTNSILVVINKLINVSNTFDKGKKYLGIYTFFINDEFVNMELIAVLVDSDK
jgi:hypothetical protein